MAGQNVSVEVDLEKNAPSKVALELARFIEVNDPRAPKRDAHEHRNYFLDLYAECLEAARGHRQFVIPQAKRRRELRYNRDVSCRYQM